MPDTEVNKLCDDLKELIESQSLRTRPGARLFPDEWSVLLTAANESSSQRGELPELTAYVESKLSRQKDSVKPCVRLSYREWQVLLTAAARQ